MNIKRVEKKLEIINDINTLSKEELNEKYLKSEEEYVEFLKTYSQYFTPYYMYQLRAAGSYDKITSLLCNGNNKYKTDDQMEYVDTILKSMRQSENDYEISGAKRDDYFQALYLFVNRIVPQNNMHIQYEDLVSKIYEGAKEYEENRDDSINDFLENIYYEIKYNVKSKEDIEKIVNDYIEKHPLLSLCNKKEFLYFVNYIISNEKKEVDIKFIADAKSVIKASRVLQEMGKVDECDKDEYNLTAALTMKNIKAQEKKAKKREEQGLKKIKQFFA